MGTFTRTTEQIEEIHNTVGDPSTNQGFTDTIGEQVIPKYTGIVYKASGGNSAVDNMIAGIPTASVLGDFVSCESGTIFERIASNGVLADFDPKGEVYAEDFGASPSLTAPQGTEVAKVLSSLNRRIIYNGGQHKITSFIDKIVATSGQTNFSITHNYGGSLTTMSRNLETLWAYSTAGGQVSGEYTFTDANNFTIQTPATASELYIVATTEIAFNHGIDMRNGATFLLEGDGAACPRFDSDAETGALGSGRIECIAGDDNQTGPLILGNQCEYNSIIARDFMTTAISIGRPNINAAYNMQIKKFTVLNSNSRPANLGVEWGGAWPQSNSNYVEQFLVKGSQLRKFRCVGQNNKAESCDFLTTSQICEIYGIIRGQGNEFFNVYDEIGTGGKSPDTIVEFGSPDETPENYSTGNTFETGLLATSVTAGSRVKNWTGGVNNYIGSGRIGGNFAGSYSKVSSRNFFENPEFLLAPDGHPYQVTSNRVSAVSVVATDTLGYNAGEGIFPSLGRNSVKVEQNGITINGPVFYYAQNAATGPSNSANNGQTFFPVEYFRGKLVSIGMWVYVTGTQVALDAATVKLIPSFGAGNEKVTEVDKWTFITASSFLKHDATAPTTLSCSLNVVNFTGNVYFSNVQITVGELPNPQGEESPLLTKGGNMHGDIYHGEGTGQVLVDTVTGAKLRLTVANGVTAWVAP